MTKQFWIFLGVGLAAVAIAVSFIWFGTKSAHLELTGNILKVRVLALGPEASLVVADFRVTNPSGVPFVVNDVRLKVTPPDGHTVEGLAASRSDIDNLFKAQKLIGPHFNDVLALRDKVPPMKTLDRMTGARFELPESAIDRRKSVVLRLEDVDGTVAELTEK
ncbi:MAG: hypothetical protein JO307_18720 [Bryobacterales bacterium]|nr:hypothetical protein [Bryobacterales bacterium]MBV9398875.1 hypothetical protein [Bryobacterales bacterium]